MAEYAERSIKAAHAGDLAVHAARKKGITDRNELAAIWIQARTEETNKDTK